MDPLSVRPISCVVEEKNGSIYIRVPCPTHGPQYSLVCTDAAFFRKCLVHDQGRMRQLRDIEDLEKQRGLDQRSDQLPLLFDLTLFKSDEFMSDDSIKTFVDRTRRTYPAGRQFVMRLSGRLASRIDTLNDKILLVHGLLKQGEPILVSVSFERLVLLADLPNSCFLKPRIFPAMKYYLRKDDEHLCLEEMSQLIRILQEFQGIKAVFSISIETPWPDLAPILQLLRSHKGLIKVVEFQLERSPRRLMDMANKAADTPSSKASLYTDHLDPVQALQTISDASNGGISLEDWYPVSIGRVFEPFLALAGMGKFSIRPSAFCGFGTVLCSSSTDDPAMQSIPVSKFVDIDQFYEGIVPLLPKLEDGIGWWTARSIKKLLSKCARRKLPDIFAYLTDKDKAPLLSKFVDELQFIVVHNQMDVLAADMQRRCACATLQVDDHALVSGCLGCI